MSKSTIETIKRELISIKLNYLDNNGAIKKSFEHTNFYKDVSYLKNQIKWYQGHWTSMSNKYNPTKVRCRSDKFLIQTIENKNNYNQSTILLSSFKYKNKIIHSVISGYWFENYPHSTQSSNSFINIEYDELIDMLENNGFYYKTIKSKNQNLTKYIIYFFDDENFDINEFLQYIDISRNLHNNNFSYLKSYSKYDPAIPNVTRKELYSTFTDSCAIHNLNPDFCRTKIDWQATKKAIENTNLNVPLDFHHFISKDIFKKAWSRKEIDDLDWKIIHSKINLIPLCQICHQSIHNEDKKLAKITFDFIMEIHIKNNTINEFLKYLKNTQVLDNINDLKDWYINNER
ncbi:hypothetical protein [Mycoplasmopsis cynos]|uniref:Uncharacterized protein n=1 Tax=Mycoplasmopsis cynos (strain C142) TaxID=1246955 RepID=L0RY88_MYCC1|nr:hypothetical protein [Mycoplasmopsis cynos]MCU9932737.1 hypothetical protein [Mycoplasmopsis cynos]UWV77886.1 hypothetical protein NW070_03325 [Mycoplasmopsis cynos]UWV81248.1 hypothetical protein NW065_04740 [Mycoplasmopsis cynos]UWV82357.1 hypothetical protein NW067_05180 [Mycoplasmopsis cynos]WAM02938.1 hypothetical protein ONA22_03730 [Mycoplasmopsis cynos]